jgi:hypothetical protein
VPRAELFHRIAEPESAEARRQTLALGLEGEVEFRNVDFDSHREALASHGGEATPALWDGTVLFEGPAAVRVALAAIVHRR